MKYLILAVSIFFSCLTASSEIKAHEQEQQNLKSESKNWKISVLWTDEIRWIEQTPPDPPQTPRKNHYFLKVVVQLEYIGPDGKVKPPLINVTDNEGNKYEHLRYTSQPSSDEFAETRDYVNQMMSLFVLEKSATLKSGTPFGRYVAFCFEVPKAYREFNLNFGDILPIQFAATVPYGRVKPEGTGTQVQSSESQESSSTGTTRVQIPSFADMDKDKNDKISREEFPGPPQLFDRFDENKDGVVTEEEFMRLRQQMSERSRQKQAQTKQQNSTGIQEREKLSKSEQNTSEPATKPLGPSSLAQSYNGFEIAVVAVERKNELKLQGLTTTYATIKAKDGYEFAVVRLKIESKGLAKVTIQDFYGRVKHLELTDFQDKKYVLDSKEAEIEIETGRSIWQLNFIVPKGTRLRTLRFEELSFDLEKL